MESYIKDTVFITDAHGAVCAFEQYARKINVHEELELKDGEMWIEKRLGKLLAVFAEFFMTPMNGSM